jgi:hypothetical protein
MTSADSEFEDLYLDALLEMADHDEPPVFHIWWSANAMFPHKPISERLSLSEGVIRKLLDEGLVDLIRSRNDGSPVPPGEWNDVLRRYFTWVPHPDEGVTMLFRITNLGRERCGEMASQGYSFSRQLDGFPGSSAKESLRLAPVRRLHRWAPPGTPAYPETDYQVRSTR